MKKSNYKRNVYMLQTQWSYEYESGVETNLFSTRKKAVKEFKRLVEENITSENYWTYDAFKDDEFEKNYEFDSNIDDTNAIEFYWEIYDKNQTYNRTYIKMRKMEVR